MKKFTNALLISACALILTHDLTAARMSRAQRQQWSRYIQQQKSSFASYSAKATKDTKASDFAKASDSAKATSDASTDTTADKPVPTPLTKQQTQTIKETKKEIAQDAKALEKEIEKAKKAKTPEEKAIAQEQAYKLAQELIQDLNEERAIYKDVYNEEELMRTDRARQIYAKLDTHKKKFTRILEKKEARLKTIKRYFWNAATPGNEEEYKTLTNDIKNLKNKLGAIDRGMQTTKAMVGESWLTAYNVMLGAVGVGVGLAAANVALFGSAGVVAATAVGYLPTTWTGAFGAATTLYGYYNKANLALSLLTNTINDPNTPEGKRQEAMLQKEAAEAEKNEYKQILNDYRDKKITKEQLEQKQKEIEARMQADKK